MSVGRWLTLLARHLDEEGRYPGTVGFVLWGTAMMRTQGDDVAEALALLGVRPVWESESRRVVGLEAIPLSELGRPRIDVTLRVSGFFRDAFPNLVRLVDEAVELAASLDEPEEDNFIRAHGAVDPRVYGPGPEPTVPASCSSSNNETGDPTTTWRRSISPGRALPTAVRASVYRPKTPCAAVRRLDVGSEEPGQSRARHLRLRRLSAGTRRHDRHDPIAHRSRPEGVVRRLRASGPSAGLFAGRRGRGSCALGWSTRSGPKPCSAMATKARSNGGYGRYLSATTPPPTWWRTGCTSG